MKAYQNLSGRWPPSFRPETTVPRIKCPSPQLEQQGAEEVIGGEGSSFLLSGGSQPSRMDVWWRRRSSVREKLSVVHIHQMYVLQHPFHPGAVAACPRVFCLAYQSLCRCLSNRYRAVQAAVTAHAHTQQRRSASIISTTNARGHAAGDGGVGSSLGCAVVALYLYQCLPHDALTEFGCTSGGEHLFRQPFFQPGTPHGCPARAGQLSGTEVHLCVSRLSPVIREAHELQTHGWEGVHPALQVWVRIARLTLSCAEVS